LHTAAPDAVAEAARDLARSASTLDELRALLEKFDGCALKATATRLVFADGAPDADIMFVGEAPGRDEDMQGKPFVGRSGQLLDRIMAAIGLDRTKAYIANAVPWRPPGNRDPTPQEVTICRPFIERQIELVNPKVLVCLGARSAAAILGINEGILKLRGRWMNFDVAGRPCRAVATLHPAFLLRSPLQKRFVWRDFRAIAAELARLQNS
jgi:DNA polymerase